jgi:hypothetical protein
MAHTLAKKHHQRQRDGGNNPYSYAHAILTLKEILLSLTTGTGSRVSVRRWSPCC